MCIYAYYYMYTKTRGDGTYFLSGSVYMLQTILLSLPVYLSIATDLGLGSLKLVGGGKMAP